MADFGKRKRHSSCFLICRASTVMSSSPRLPLPFPGLVSDGIRQLLHIVARIFFSTLPPPIPVLRQYAVAEHQQHVAVHQPVFRPLKNDIPQNSHRQGGFFYTGYTPHTAQKGRAAPAFRLSRCPLKRSRQAMSTVAMLSSPDLTINAELTMRRALSDPNPA